MNPDKAEPLKVVAPELMQAEQLRMTGELPESLRICFAYLDDHFEDVAALILAGRILLDSKRLGAAQAMLKLATILMPESSLAWSDLGCCYQEGSDPIEGEACFIKALARDPNNSFALNNLSQLYAVNAQPMKAINCADKAIRLDPNLQDSHYNRGLSLLQLGNWAEGWKGFDSNLGMHKGRKERVYGIIPRWTGVEGLKLIVYGEQGLGDEIFFSSCMPDVMKKNEVFLECDPRLKGLLERSFGCKTFGTRFDKKVSWPLDYDIDAAVAIGSLPGFYRNKDADFPGTPFLKADPERRLMYRSLLKSLGDKKKVGISWTGGLKNTGTARRSLSLLEMMPILRQDATFISLQYKDTDEIKEIEKQGIKIHHWPYAIQSNDYDDTAALVAELDLVISVTQSAIHVAGGLGVPCWVLVPREPLWRYGLSGDKMLWYNSVKLYRQKKEWVHTISEVARDLRDLCK